MEAMAAGSVVIGADAGGIPDVVQHGVNGFLFDPKDGEDLPRTARRVLAEPALCQVIRSKAREQSEQWSWEAATLQLVRFYEEASNMPRLEKS